MGTTYVYFTTRVDDTVSLALTMLRPKDLGGGILNASSVGKDEKEKLIMSVPRSLDMGMYILDTSLTIGSSYIASLEIMLRGHGWGSMIWWRWRKASPDVGYWYTDHNPHDTWINARGYNYHFVVTGHGTFGYDDVYLDLTT